MSADANIYNLQNVECHCEISSRSPRFAKSIYEPKWCFSAEFLSSGARLWLWFDSQLRHNGFRKPGLQTSDFPIILQMRHSGTEIQFSQRMQSAVLRMRLEQR